MSAARYMNITSADGRRGAFGGRSLSSLVSKRGTVLIISMWIVIFLAGLVISFSWSSRVDLAATANYVSSVQSEAAARSAMRVLTHFAAESAGKDFDPALPPSENVDVGVGFYWFIRRDPEDESRIVYGIYDEGSKLNINTSTEEMLEKLPGMTESIAAAIVEWRGRERRGEESPVEIDSYLFLPEPYHMKRAPFETIEELLYVRGMTPEILYGDDYNAGIFRYITVHSVEPNRAANGEARININDGDRDALLELLSDVIESEEELDRISSMLRRRSSFRNIIDFYIRLRIAPELFQEFEDRLTATDAQNIPGRMNVLTAPRQALLCLPGLDEQDVDALIAARSSPPDDPLSVTWIAEVLSDDKAVEIGDYITTRSFQFSAEIAAVARDGRAFQRYRAVVDARDNEPRLVYRKNITRQGWPLDVGMLDDIRAGGI